MLVRRLTAVAVLAALVGSLALPWFGEGHQFNDDPHWAITLRADDCTLPMLSDGAIGDETHCEVCHWLRTMRSADRPASVAYGLSLAPSGRLADAAVQPVITSEQPGAARAPPASL
jgi:hypothetical protein